MQRYNDKESQAAPAALERTDCFVGRTMNWLYDHLRYVPRYDCGVLSDEIMNRDEFPALTARGKHYEKISRRAWRRATGIPLYLTDWLWVNRLRPRVLHSHFGYVGWQDLQLARFLDIPWFVSFYGADAYQQPRSEVWRRRYAQVFEHATRVLALGPVMADKLIQLGCPESKVLVHPLGVEVDVLPVVPRVLKRGETMQLLFAGSFREKKGIPYILDAMGSAAARGVDLRLHLVGDAWNKQGDVETKNEVLKRIQDLGLGSRVVQYPFLKFADLLNLALQCHLFMAPSVSSADGDAEGTPFVLQQMMATAMPCIATVHSDIPFLFGKHHRLLVPERDSDAIADRLVGYAERPEQLTDHGYRLSEQMRTNLDVKACAGVLSGHYDDAVQERAADRLEEESHVAV